MNIYFCKDCGAPVEAPHCSNCKSYNVEITGDLHLPVLGLDVYINVTVDALGNPFLIVKKPSGQREIRLRDEDFLKGHVPTKQPRSALQDLEELFPHDPLSSC